ncbi:isoprenylcysteine carboxylmethyltransferase family protein [Pseudoalteromonas sp. DL2-H2.2]|uniref:methyltransferase family protein n=1 Tax=Pseudoalteromonas sp. DL2-H2.2 TaxID=2908889 RepID=UPI001F453B6A|nr:isoprenylcysteine carboxylmethyltransferase family protein [Pseudoalteromonas sp. DL2-H2.2]MCF2908494.1 isoprenylcysteine carboxylmethyltransferase family protein [Pseudoalteromonas sp. DL2-H2.2]
MQRLLPPILLILFITIMLVGCWYSELAHLLLTPYNLLGLPFLLGGLALAQTAKGIFKQAKTNIMTFDDPDKLITQGPFAYSRNPMYLGMSSALLGCALLCGATQWSLGLTLLFIVVVDFWYIRHEEQAMGNKFAEDYEEYRARVRRWL